MTDATVRRDQFDQVIPDDLVVISGIDFELLSARDIDRIDRADWYVSDEDVRGPILASFRQIGGVTETDPEDWGVDPVAVLVHVSPVLHRWSPEDGFYHA